LFRKRDWLGGLIGLAAFLAGIAIILWSFQTAFVLFNTPPETTLNIPKGKTLNVNDFWGSVIRLVYKIVMLLFMCFIGSIVANRGIKLYGESQRGVPGAAPAPGDVRTQEEG
jgi:hypothetical protein